MGKNSAQVEIRNNLIFGPHRCGVVKVVIQDESLGHKEGGHKHLIP